MKLAALAAVGAVLASPAFAQWWNCNIRDTDNPETNIYLNKFDTEDCEHGDNDEHKVEHGDCKNFDYGFNSFWYQKDSGFMGNDNDESDCRCALFVFSEKDCKGTQFCVGSVFDMSNMCIPLGKDRLAFSARVQCDNGHELLNRALCEDSPFYKEYWREERGKALPSGAAY